MSKALEPLRYNEFQEIIDTLRTKKATAKQKLEILEVIEDQSTN